MITKPTVLILGAGASMPYGFPSGQDLLKNIDSKLNRRSIGSHPSPDWIAILKGFGIAEGDIETFRRDLFYSRMSVDAFLEHRPEFFHVGKLAITLSLIQYEDEDCLFSDNTKNWYDYLRGKLNAPFEDFGKNKLSVITFNYDRSIEHYLFKVLKSTYGKPDEECAEKLKKIPIIHVHGRLGALPWQTMEGGRAYTTTVVPEEVKVATEQIIVIPEGQDTSSEFEKAFDIMMAADKIYFLGFGYNDVNLRRLAINKIRLASKVVPFAYGTAYGLGASEMQAISEKWGISLGSDHGDVFDFLRNRALLE